jgi:outer membrane lipoprotein-sorting protein
MNRPAVRALPALAMLAILAACKPATTPEGAANAAGQAGDAAPAAAHPAAVVAQAVLPDAKGQVVDAMRKFAGVRSYHASMHMEGGPRGPMTNELDFVAPDRFRMELAGMGTQVIVGDTMYMSVSGRTMKVPMPAGTLTQWRDPARLGEAEANMTVDDQGSDSVDGQSATKYVVHVTQPKESTTTLWIGDAGLPLQILAHNAMGDATIRYSRFNDPSIAIEAPK